ncbi:MAG: site-specific integrase [Cyanothece sp. SIO1E1]|nr:site-specific integrase [Cyanothece sp. SIO1E1]
MLIPLQPTHPPARSVDLKEDANLVKPTHRVEDIEDMPVSDPIPEFRFFDHPEQIESSENPVDVISADLRWLQAEKFLQSRPLTANTRKAYERDLKRFLNWTDQPWSDVTNRQLANYTLYLRSQPSARGGKLSPATIKRSLSSLHSFFKWLSVEN